MVLDAAAPEEKSVNCPRCGLPCTLQPLKRPGAYRLVDADGNGHAGVCIDAPQHALAAPPRYRPAPVIPLPVPIEVRKSNVRWMSQPLPRRGGRP